MNHKTSILLQRLRKHASEISDADRASIEQDLSKYRELEQLVAGKLVHICCLNLHTYVMETSDILPYLNNLNYFFMLTDSAKSSCGFGLPKDSTDPEQGRSYRLLAAAETKEAGPTTG